MSAKATKLGSCDKPGALNECFSLQKISFGEANIGSNFLSLGDGEKFLDERSIHKQFSKLVQ